MAFSHMRGEFGKTAVIGGLSRLSGRTLLIGLMAVLVAGTAIVLASASASADCEEGQIQWYCGPSGYEPQPEPEPEPEPQPRIGIGDLIPISISLIPVIGPVIAATIVLTGADDAMSETAHQWAVEHKQPLICVDRWCPQ